MYLTKSKYCDAVQCKKMLWLSENNPEVGKEVANSSILDNGVEVGNVAKDLLGSHINIEFDSNLNNMIKATKKALENKNIVITEASFKYNNNFCSVDLLKKSNDVYEIYEVKSSTELKDVYIDDISYQYYVLKKLGFKVSNCFIVYVNNKYIRKGELELDKLFNVEDVTIDVYEKQDYVEKSIESINKYMDQTSEPLDDIGVYCKSPYDCPFFEYCTRKLEKPNVFDIRKMTSKKKFELYYKGSYTFDSLMYEKINPKQKQQVEYELYDLKPHIDEISIKHFLDTLSYPLYFLDFETYQQPIPLFDDVKPYMQIPFQYSLHYIDSIDGDLKHTEFLGDGVTDPRRKLAEQLVSDIPMNVCTVAYNMMFEKMVIKNLAETYPDLEKHLMNIHDNMKDLMVPFINRDYYTRSMKGSYSIKYVLPALFPEDPSLDYHNLDMVHNGSEAMSSYANLNKMTKKEQEKLRYNMLKYCELDTYAMVKIWKHLTEI